MSTSKLFDDIPDQSGKVAIVTGGNTGIGKVTCKVLVAKGAKVYMGARNQEKAEEAINDIKKETGKEAIYWLPLDLADLASVREAAENFKRQEKELHILINNAAVMAIPFSRTKDGYEMQWGTNVVGHFALIKGLLPTLLETASHTPQGTVRVINVSSVAHKMLAPKGGIVFNDLALTGGWWFAEWRRYGMSKLANVLLTKEISQRFKERGIISVALHPGVIKTQLHSNVKQSWSILLPMKMDRTPKISEEEGAYTQLYAATHPRAVTENWNGKYLVPMAKLEEPAKEANNLELARKLWDYLDAEVGPKLQ